MELNDFSESDSENENCIQWVEESDSPVSDFDENECDTDDTSILISTPENIVPTICGYEKETKSDDFNPKRKKLKLNERLSLQDGLNTEIIHENWTKACSYSSDNVTLISDPFQLCVIKNFIDNPTILNAIRHEINSVKWNKRRLDLYEFLQTDDLVNIKMKYIHQLYEFLKNEVRPWISKATGLPLTKTSASCSAYTFGDYLLVHDDLQGDRCVAFILYLTGLDENNDEIWKPDFGGALQLFGKDEFLQPNIDSMKNIFPQHNQFVFFQVKKDSYHQVQEVFSMNHSRISINGWFHSDQIPLEEPPNLAPETNGLFGSNCIHPKNEQISLEKWINPLFLKDTTCKNIQEHIEKFSEISLEQFFNENCLENLLNLNSNTISWKWIGPPNRRRYEIADESTLPENLREFLDVFKSISMFELLKKYTELDLVPEGDMKPSMRFELQRFSPGCYSLMSEKSWFNDCELDVILYIECIDENNGQIMYVAREENEQEALITLVPKPNTLNIVYRDEGTARIMPYLPHRIKNKQFYVLICSYKQ